MRSWHRAARRYGTFSSEALEKPTLRLLRDVLTRPLLWARTIASARFSTESLPKMFESVVDHRLGDVLVIIPKQKNVIIELGQLVDQRGSRRFNREQ